MLRSMYSGVSGMKGFQTKLDVIGNNIANVNTVGYKKSRVMFQDVLSQNLSGVSAPEEGTRGGVNPRQVGLGVQIGAIDTLHTPGSPMTTGVLTDLAIAGDGFFLVVPPGMDPNDGNYYLTRAGNFTLDAEGQLVTSDGYLVLGFDVDDDGNAINSPISIRIDPDADFVAYDITRNGNVIGYLEDGTSEVIAVIALGLVNNPGGLRKIGGSLYEMTANAHPDGALVWGQNLGTIDSLGVTTEIISGMLEMSNVDLTEEFTEMIIAQRGFQANSRIITTSDEILQEVVNLKR
ncbi:flagellar hook protein FlgE [Caldalkalibacillus uzonensis]|uniref:Flagellar hook protein FlgE n=1 Tax=Caldalkalibacillus uzonensis TaxID=353224 RepID=A0ABU0CLH6_9BACI|nr:flagellar hook-basal body complex protein [Caldalkalibacillus uzonensis]MDQ0337270.1 flagellar hook protein FlgE [Caldalkalibacillus uzonensis]